MDVVHFVVFLSSIIRLFCHWVNEKNFPDGKSR